MKNSSLTPQEYEEMIRRVSDQRYNTEDTSNAWIPSVSPAKERMLQKAKKTVTCDLSTAKRDKINDAVQVSDVIHCDQFMIKIISRYQPMDTYSLIIYEEKTRTPSGAPCNMQYPVDVINDSRFKNSSWVIHFNGKRGSNIPESVVVDIVRWLQAMKKLTAFV